MQKSTRILTAICFIAFLATFSAALAISTTLTLDSNLHVNSYTSLKCTIDDVEIHSLEWGVIDPSATKTINVSITNIGNTESNLLTMTNNLNPEVGTITWDAPTDRTLLSGEPIDVTFTLTINPTAPSGDFNCQIYINA